MSEVISCLIKGATVVDLPVPSNINFGKERIAKEQRALDGTMVIDLIATKSSYELNWDLMSIPVLNSIKQIVEAESVFFDLTIGLRKGTLKTVKNVSVTAEFRSRLSAGTRSILENSSKVANQEMQTETINAKVFLSDLNYTPFFVGDGFIWKDVSMKVTER